MARKKQKISTNPEPAAFTLGDALGFSMSTERTEPEKNTIPDKAAAPASPEEFPAGKYRLNIERKGRAGKDVTRLTCPSLSKKHISRLKTALGCGASVEEESVIFQGDQRERLRALLKKYGVKDVK